MKTNTQMMKNLFRFSGGFAAFFFLFFVNGTAQQSRAYEQPVLKVQYLMEDNGFLCFQTSVLLPEGKFTILKISNQANELLYSEKITEREFQKVYKFPKQEDGEVRFLLTGGKEFIRKNFAIHTQTEDRYVIKEIAVKN